MSDMPSYKKIDMETWPRREHFKYYRTALKCGYSLTARIDVTDAVLYAHRHNLHFHCCLIYTISKAINSLDEMKMMVDGDGNPGIWDVVHPNFTVFHEDDKTFSDMWVEYEPGFDAFHERYNSVTAEFGGNHGIKARPGQPANFFCVSCEPWTDFEGYSTYSTAADPMLFPVITCGRYTKADGRITMPVAITISHASADGYHVSEFFTRLQKSLVEFSREL